MRKAPAWFVKKLEVIDRALRVRWNEKRAQWEIGEMVPWGFNRGALSDGRALFHLTLRWQRVIFVDDLGTAVLDYINRVRINRFQTVEQMVKDLDIDKTEANA